MGWFSPSMTSRGRRPTSRASSSAWPPPAPTWSRSRRPRGRWPTSAVWRTLPPATPRALPASSPSPWVHSACPRVSSAVAGEHPSSTPRRGRGVGAPPGPPPPPPSRAPTAAAPPAPPPPPTPPPAESLPPFRQALPPLALAGFSVTRPYKVEILPHLARVDAVAAATGSVNTVVVGRDGALEGSSTDGDGVLGPLP